MKYRFFFSILVLSVCSVVHAERMMHIMQDYNAKTLSLAEMDSVLNEARGEGRYKLEYTNQKKLFRHSFYADYYLLDTQKHDTIWLCDEPVRDAVLSPNGKYVVYAKSDNHLYIYKVDFKTEVGILGDEAKGKDMYYGVSDWLYEEEFGVTCLFAFSPDSKQVAFVQLDEKEVPTFEWQTFLGEPTPDPSLKGREEARGDETIRRGGGGYPMLHSLRYPKAGEANAKASVCVYDIHYKSIRTMQLPEHMDGYVPRIAWTPMREQETKSQEQGASELVILHMNRDQNRMDVLKGNPKSTVCHPFYKEESKQYFVNYELFDQWQWLQDGRVVVISEKGGYTQAYLYNAQGVEQKLLTPAERDITRIYGVDERTQTLYYEAAPTPMTRQAYALNIRKNSTVQLTQGEGTHSLTFSDDWSRYIDCYHSTTMPHRYTLYETGRSKEPGTRNQDKIVTERGEVLLDNDSLLQAWQALGVNEKEFFTIETERGDVLNAWRILPRDFDETKKYPVVMMQYSGPTSQRVLNNWRKRFGYSLADAGYIVVCADGRGTGARGRVWRNATYMQLGVKEAEDQMSVARYLQTLPYVDADRIALCGWSYGGYQTLMCMSRQGAKPTPNPSLKGREKEQVGALWKCGIAIAPVTSWRLYDSAYTERFMRRPQVNEFGYDGTDLMQMAGDLQGQLLLVHGMADDNVHAQNTYLYMDALVQAGKQFEMQLYVDDNHSMRKPANYKHLHERIMLFLENNL